MGRHDRDPHALAQHTHAHCMRTTTYQNALQLSAATGLSIWVQLRTERGTQLVPECLVSQDQNVSPVTDGTMHIPNMPPGWLESEKETEKAHLLNFAQIYQNFPLPHAPAACSHHKSQEGKGGVQLWGVLTNSCGGLRPVGWRLHQPYLVPAGLALLCLCL